MSQEIETSEIDINLSDHRQELADAIISAYPSTAKLTTMIRDRFKKNPDIVAGGETLDVKVSNCIQWAISQSKEKELLKAVYQGNPNDKDLKIIIKKLQPILLETPLYDEQITKKWYQRITLRHLGSTVLTSISLTTFIIAIRLLGVFENSELFLFDQMMRHSPTEEQDKRLLIIKITPEDIEHYAEANPPKNGASLSDEIIYKLVSTLLDKKPKIIGIDLYRYAKPEGKLAELLNEKKTDKRLVFICKFPDNISNKDGGRHNPPRDVPLEQVGLSDFISDSDGVIRRQLIQMGTPTTQDTENSKCRNPKQDGLMNSFSLQVAQKYLNENMEFGFSIVKPFDNILKPLDISKQGGYSLRDLNGFQILLNYRYAHEKDNPNSYSVSNIAPQFTVQQILKNGINESFIKDKIVLIGTTAEGYDSSFLTPFSKAGPDQPIQGLFIQAQMVSQLVSAIEDNRPLIKVCSLELEILWILFWSLIGASLALLCKQPRKLIILGIICIGSLFIICILLFISPIKFWISFYPSALAFLSTGIMIVLLELRYQNKNQLDQLTNY
ncbi:MAG: CHASE2 domain-containing protein [Nostoc sp. SerVER01]|nr:CHASE2 domain-containing protein [Nostoc sp. SerVER01]